VEILDHGKHATGKSVHLFVLLLLLLRELESEVSVPGRLLLLLSLLLLALLLAQFLLLPDL